MFFYGLYQIKWMGYNIYLGHIKRHVLVISDSFLLVGKWDSDLENSPMEGVSKIDFTQSINKSLYNEKDISNILASSLRKAQEIINFSDPIPPIFNRSLIEKVFQPVYQFPFFVLYHYKKYLKAYSKLRYICYEP